MIKCYVSNEVSERGHKNEFYDSLPDVFRSVNRFDIVILMGDLNYELGSDK